MRFLMWAGTLCSIAGLSACSSQPMISDPSQVVFPDSAISFRATVQPFMTVTCAFSQCHGEMSPAGGVRLNDYTGILFSRGNLAVPGKPDESLIIQILDKRIAHAASVLDRVNANHYAGMRRWISEGALNN